MGVIVRRRQADLERLRELAAANPGRIDILGVDGDPPNTIRFRLNCRSITAMSAVGPTYGNGHHLRVTFGERYPMEQPLVYLESPIWNPHIFASTRRICIGTAWSPSETLDVFIQRVWAILAWDPQVIDPNSPANMEALRWSETNRTMLPIEPARLRSSSEPAPSAPKPRISWRG
ncbi:MAG TPA: ubiquitin-conjugating enzyme E2 [Thermomicrobiales bacterium]|jgi:hypothetical protein|nr:ubiquitin-conjugating enzyme E2 [Thermomicrobiales bacterium]